jgi:hypothetical protein
MMPLTHRDERPHPGSAVEEWVFAAWTPDARIGVLSGHRLLGRHAWYWAALAQAGEPLFHVAEFDIAVRRDPFIVKAQSLWAEHTCDAPMEQWSIGNETYASALDDPTDGSGRAYGIPTPIAFDLEWYAIGPPVEIAEGYEQRGVVHGAVELAGRPRLDLVEVPAHRWHRWTPPEPERPDGGGIRATLGPLPVPQVRAHTGVRAPFAFPDGSVVDFVLTPAGWGAVP